MSHSLEPWQINNDTPCWTRRTVWFISRPTPSGREYIETARGRVRMFRTKEGAIRAARKLSITFEPLTLTVAMLELTEYQKYATKRYDKLKALNLWYREMLGESIKHLQRGDAQAKDYAQALIEWLEDDE